MKPNSQELALLEEQLQRTKSPFERSGFYERRKEWGDLLDRRSEMALEPALRPYQVNIRSPRLESAAADYVKVLAAAPTKVDIVVKDEGKNVEDDLAAVKVFTTASYVQQNKGGLVEQARFEQQVQFGVAVEFKGWTMPTEPEKGKDREAHYLENCQQMFTTTPIPYSEMCWWPLDPDEVAINGIVFQESVVKYVDLLAFETRDKRRIRYLPESKEITVLGADEPTPERGNVVLSDMPSIHIVRRAMKKDGCWWVTCYAYPENGNLLDNGEIWDEYECPFDECPFIITASGDQRVTATDPHLRFRPGLMYPLYVLVQEQNQLLTRMMSLAVKRASDENVVFEIAPNMGPEAAALLSELSVEIPGGGRKMLFERGKPGTGELAGVPGKLSLWPNDLGEGFMIRLAQIQEEIREYLPNTYLTGKAFDEQREGTMGAYLAALEAAGLPLGQYLKKSDRSWERNLAMEHQAIKRWPEAKIYPVIAKGDEPMEGGSPVAGMKVTITPKMLKHNYEIRVDSRGETAAEKRERLAQADRDFMSGAMTFEQWIGERYADVKKQVRLLEVWNAQKAVEPEMVQLRKAAMVTLIGKDEGLDLPGLFQAVGGGEASASSSPPPVAPAPMNNNGAPAVAGPAAPPNLAVMP